MAMSPGFCRKTKTTQLIQACTKRKRNKWKEGRRQVPFMPEAFGIKSGKSPNFGRIKASLALYYESISILLDA
jgi:hypothetical protein